MIIITLVRGTADVGFVCLPAVSCVHVGVKTDVISEGCIQKLNYFTPFIPISA